MERGAGPLFRAVHAVQLETGLLQDLYEFQEKQNMAYLTNAERVGLARGLRKGIERLLKSKFGPDGAGLMEECRKIEDVERLESILDAIDGCATLDDVRRLLAS
jgi:hypothetical protein